MKGQAFMKQAKKGESAAEARLTTLLLHHAAFLDHATPPGHPERPDRLRALHGALDNETFQTLDRQDAPLGDAAVAGLVHPDAYVKAIRKAVPEDGLTRIDPDTVASPGSWEAVMRALGAATFAIDAVMAGRAANAFAAVRPPGHHAETNRAMGFCLFNTIAAAARYAQQSHGLERVAIIDWDVHHGNGTQEIFWDDPSVLYASTHQMPLFPGTGALSETGAGNIVNAPLSPGDNSERFRQAFNERILKSVTDFHPDLILISAGFDAHYRDPLGEIRLTGEDFAWATGKLMDIADLRCEGRIVSMLEGGYDLEGLAESAAAHITQLMQA
jgi:acetoin utilization deacetylase AcuC-like enzyme